MSELHYLSATDALRMFRSRELSPVELMESVIARTEAVDPAVNALPHRFFDQVETELRAAMLLTGSQNLRALAKAPRLLGAELREWLALDA